MNDVDNKKAADIAIQHLQRLMQFHKETIERWKNSEYCDNDIAKDIKEGSEKSIKEIEEEIAALEQYKATGVFVSRQAREMMSRYRTKINKEDER